MHARLMHAMVEGGADVIELGVPSPTHGRRPGDPEGWRPALALGIGMVQVLAMAHEFRQTQHHHARGADGLRQPGGALRPEATGEGCLCARRGEAAGVDGVLIVDYPPECAKTSLPNCARTAWT